jgi:hypothetical protein
MPAVRSRDSTTANPAARTFSSGPDGTITIFNVAKSQDTETLGISDKGAVIGTYGGKGFSSHGFLRSPAGTITSFDPPGSAFTAPESINRSGVIAGFYYDSNDIAHGFVRSP